jgi:pre-rRNA-processing protein TSR3
MNDHFKTLILRHRRENLKKCSLRGLEDRLDISFFSYPSKQLLDLSGYILLGMDAPELSREDNNKGIFLIDATWRYAQKMFHQIPNHHSLTIRSIPSCFVTAYPRRQDDCPDPSKGLASIEALYIAYLILERDPSGLLDSYHWKEKFLEINSKALQSLLIK